MHDLLTKIGITNVKIPKTAIAAIGIFALFLGTFPLTGESNFLVRGIPSLILLLVIPLLHNYMSQSPFSDLALLYETEEKNIRIKVINESMIGKVVRIQGLVKQAHFPFLNRPQFIVTGSGEISVKMFTAPTDDVNMGDVVEVPGMIIWRSMVVGDPVVNCGVIRKIDTETGLFSAPGEKPGRKKRAEPCPSSPVQTAFSCFSSVDIPNSAFVIEITVDRYFHVSRKGCLPQSRGETTRNILKNDDFSRAPVLIFFFKNFHKRFFL